MPHYVSLINWTEQGVKNFRDTTKRADDFSALAKRHGGKVESLLWTVGEYDIVSVVEFPDDESSVAALLELGAAGNVRTKTMKAFSSDEMTGIIGRTGWQRLRIRQADFPPIS